MLVRKVSYDISSRPCRNLTLPQRSEEHLGSRTFIVHSSIHSECSLIPRALDGDAVAVELLPEAQWRAPSKVLPSAAHREQAPDTAGAKHTDAAGADAEPDGGHIAQARARLLRCHDSFDGRA